jgi:hypothetical protein
MTQYCDFALCVQTVSSVFASDWQCQGQAKTSKFEVLFDRQCHMCGTQARAGNQLFQDYTAAFELA